MEHLDPIAAQLEALADRCVSEIRRLEAQPGHTTAPDILTDLRVERFNLRQFNRALMQYLRGARPQPAGGGAYLIASASQPGLVHRIEPAGRHWICGPTCDARGFHWHEALMVAVTMAAPAAPAAELVPAHVELDPLDSHLSTMAMPEPDPAADDLGDPFLPPVRLERPLVAPQARPALRRAA